MSTVHQANRGTLGSLNSWRRIIWHCRKENGPLVTRYYLFDNAWFGIYLHRLHSNDEDRALHDHPWSFLTFLFSSGYWEHCLVPGYDAGWYRRHVEVCRWRRRFSVLYRPAEWRHRLELAKHPTWTLVLRGPRRRLWGFWTPTGWMDFKEYGNKFCD